MFERLIWEESEAEPWWAKEHQISSNFNPI